MSLLTLSAQLKYRVTVKADQTDNYLGTIVADPYRWLENDNSDYTKARVKEQNMVINAYLDQIAYRHELKKRIDPQKLIGICWRNVLLIFLLRIL
ncbi:MAG: hypothetical protein KGL19_10555 [Bacteroidota bacterium]|nr:hypothetical protein [Bacteroidota bacterium]